MFERQNPRNQVLYADLLQEVLSATLPEGRGLSFARKNVKGRHYLYLSVAVGRRRLQAYLGPATEELEARIAATRARWNQAQAAAGDRRRLVAHLVSGGAAATPAATGSILATLADGGVFRAGAVLVGTLAFQCYANMLGVRWPGEALRTRDIDIAADRIGLAVTPEGVSLPDILEAAGGFVSIPSLLWKHPSTSFEQAGQHIDLLTPLRGRPSSEPVYVERLGVHAEPLRFLDYIIEGAQPTVLLAKDGIAVNVPDPSRFAVHKLVVSQRRGAAWATKATKDRAQAAQLLEVLLEDLPGGLADALGAARRYHDKFYETAMRAVNRLPEAIRAGVSELAEAGTGD